MLNPGPKYRDVPHLVEEKEFRSQFKSWDLGDLTYVDVRHYLSKKDMILVPMASLEQHGQHLPLYTDTVTAWEISTREAEMTAVMHTPALWTGDWRQRVFEYHQRLLYT